MDGAALGDGGGVDPAELDIPSLAALAGDAAVRDVLRRLAAAGHGEVRSAHGYLFQRLLAGEPTIGELAESLGITQQGASKHVADLERRGYAERVADGDDQRVRRVRLTEAGRAAIDAGRTARADLERALEDRFDAHDLAAARRVLAGLLDITGETPLVARRAMPLPGE